MADPSRTKQLRSRDPGPLTRAGTRERERGDEPRLEMFGIGLDRGHGFVVRDQHVTPRDGTARTGHKLVGHARNVPSVGSRVPCLHSYGTGSGGIVNPGVLYPHRSDPFHAALHTVRVAAKFAGLTYAMS